MKKITSTLLASALCLSLLAGCSQEAEQESAGAELEEAVAITVLDEEITGKEYAYFLKAGYEELFQGVPATKQDYIDNFEEASDIALYYAQSEKAIDRVLSDYNIEVTEEDTTLAEADISQFITQYGEEEFAAILQSIGIDEAGFLERLEKTKAYQREYLTIYGNGGLSEEELYEHYEEDLYKAQHILISFDTHVHTEDETEEEHNAALEEVRVKAQEVLDRALAGEDFNALMAEFSTDPGQPETGYAFPAGMMVAEFEEAVVNGVEGEVYPELVETSYGYHIIKNVAASEEQFEDNKDVALQGDYQTNEYEVLNELFAEEPVYGETFDSITAENFADLLDEEIIFALPAEDETTEETTEETTAETTTEE